MIKKPLLKLGSTNSTEVKVLQQALTNWGVFKDPIDGNFGPLTEKAVKLFQTKKRIPSDGIVGPATWTLLLNLSPKLGQVATESSSVLTHKEVIKPGTRILTPNDVNWGDMAFQLTEHFTLGENLQFDARRIPKSVAVQKNILAVINELEKIRVDFSKPISITSGYRPEAINKSVGGASKSQHILGTALDIRPASGMTLAFQDWLDKNWYGALGYGFRKNFVHLDIRNGKGWKTGGVKGVRWNY